MADVWAIAWKASFNIVAKEEMPPKSQSHCGDDRWRWSGRLKSQAKLGQVGSMISVELNGPGISRQGRTRWSGTELEWRRPHRDAMEPETKSEADLQALAGVY